MRLVRRSCFFLLNDLVVAELFYKPDSKEYIVKLDSEVFFTGSWALAARVWFQNTGIVAPGF